MRKVGHTGSKLINKTRQRSLGTTFYGRWWSRPQLDYKFGGVSAEWREKLVNWGEEGRWGETKKSRIDIGGEKVEKGLGRETQGQCVCEGGFPCPMNVGGPFADIIL